MLLLELLLFFFPQAIFLGHLADLLLLFNLIILHIGDVPLSGHLPPRIFFLDFLLKLLVMVFNYFLYFFILMVFFLPESLEASLPLLFEQQFCLSSFF